MDSRERIRSGDLRPLPTISPGCSEGRGNTVSDAWDHHASTTTVYPPFNGAVGGRDTSGDLDHRQDSPCPRGDVVPTSGWRQGNTDDSCNYRDMHGAAKRINGRGAGSAYLSEEQEHRPGDGDKDWGMLGERSDKGDSSDPVRFGLGSAAKEEVGDSSMVLEGKNRFDTWIHGPTARTSAANTCARRGVNGVVRLSCFPRASDYPQYVRIVLDNSEASRGNVQRSVSCPPRLSSHPITENQLPLALFHELHPESGRPPKDTHKIPESRRATSLGTPRHNQGMEEPNKGETSTGRVRRGSNDTTGDTENERKPNNGSTTDWTIRTYAGCKVFELLYGQRPAGDSKESDGGRSWGNGAGRAINKDSGILEMPTRLFSELFAGLWSDLPTPLSPAEAGRAIKSISENRPRDFVLVSVTHGVKNIVKRIGGRVAVDFALGIRGLGNAVVLTTDGRWIEIGADNNIFRILSRDYQDGLIKLKDYSAHEWEGVGEWKDVSDED